MNGVFWMVTNGGGASTASSSNVAGQSPEISATVEGFEGGKILSHYSHGGFSLENHWTKSWIFENYHVWWLESTPYNPNWVDREGVSHVTKQGVWKIVTSQPQWNIQIWPSMESLSQKLDDTPRHFLPCDLNTSGLLRTFPHDHPGSWKSSHFIGEFTNGTPGSSHRQTLPCFSTSTMSYLEISTMTPEISKKNRTGNGWDQLRPA